MVKVSELHNLRKTLVFEVYAGCSGGRCCWHRLFWGNAQQFWKKLELGPE
jgi:hypothetical protein